MNAPIEGGTGLSECRVESSETQTARRRAGAVIVALAAGSDA
jgi:hypothetical protein